MIKVSFSLRGYSGRAPKVFRDLSQVKTSRRRGLDLQDTSGSRYLQVVRNGKLTRIRVPEKKIGKSEQPELSKITSDIISTSPRRLLNWMKANAAVMTLNFGSVCILFGFTRSDVLELRSLTMTGQMTFAVYNLAQTTVLWPSVVWSTLFASANAWKIVSTYRERTAQIHMSEEQERIFVSFFMNHGVTPMQFSWIEAKAETIYVKKGHPLIQKGDVVDRIFLVVHGSTHAHIDGQRLTAASTSPETRGDQLEGGDSGAWIGELAFLDYFHRRHDNTVTDLSIDPASRQGRGVSLYTIIADDDCKIMVWTYATMEELMGMSSDLCSAMVRATTAAVVAKFVNLTIGNVDGSDLNLISWLPYWQLNDGSQIKVGSAAQ
jgi:CRP-like cAMP-binding protein